MPRGQAWSTTPADRRFVIPERPLLPTPTPPFLPPSWPAQALPLCCLFLQRAGSPRLRRALNLTIGTMAALSRASCTLGTTQLDISIDDLMQGSLERALRRAEYLEALSAEYHAAQEQRTSDDQPNDEGGSEDNWEDEQWEDTLKFIIFYPHATLVLVATHAIKHNLINDLCFSTHMRTKITSKQSKELKCSALLGSPSPAVQAWLAAKSSQPGSAKARALERLAEARLRKSRVETLMRLRQPPLRTIFCSDGLVVPGVETSRRIAEAAAKRAADRLEAEQRATRKLKVRSLELLPIHTPHCLEGPEWESVLHQMRNLKNLGMSKYVELTDVGRQGITFRLTHFTAFEDLVASWSALLQTQPHIVHLELDLTISDPAPVLPALKTLIARSGPAAEMLEKNSITELILSQPDTDLRGISDTALEVFSRAQPGLVTLRLGSGELLALANLPNLCLGIVHLIVDADRTWVWDKQLRTLRSALSQLKKKNTPALLTLRLFAWDRQPSAKNLFKAVRARGPVARLTTVHYCNEWGCHHWSRSKDDVGHELPCDFFEGKVLEYVEDAPSWLDGEDSDEEVVLPPDSEFWDLDDTDREPSSDSE
ncbi:hypothetical protein C8J57DRAFT_1517350 [Mycena rebaudengoi]|nr:hypothetical protein C8J57DRAFT_1517350 [Mycena rebaudengoi]